jgi:hypothetical protein
MEGARRAWRRLQRLWQWPAVKALGVLLEVFTALLVELWWAAVIAGLVMAAIGIVLSLLASNEE